MGKERLRKKFGLGKNLFRKKYLGEKIGFGKTSIALFDLGKKMPPRKGGGDDKFGKYIALPFGKCTFF